MHQLLRPPHYAVSELFWRFLGQLQTRQNSRELLDIGLVNFVSDAFQQFFYPRQTALLEVGVGEVELDSLVNIELFGKEDFLDIVVNLFAVLELPHCKGDVDDEWNLLPARVEVLLGFKLHLLPELLALDRVPEAEEGVLVEHL